MTPKKDPRAEAAAEKYAADHWNDECGWTPSYDSFIAGVSWKEANPTPQATDAKMPPREFTPGNSTFDRRCAELARVLFHEWANGCEEFEAIDEDHAHALVGQIRNLLMRELRRAHETQNVLLSQARAEARQEQIAELFAAIGSDSRYPVLERISGLTDADIASAWTFLHRYVKNEDHRKAPVEPAKAAGSPYGAGETTKESV
jgi:hypothetical protein